ncbi:sel1 repeat family protein [Psychrobacter sp. N25K4-3-2]|uniref:tetratricopeptide repeat protein n=1 Tax=Psychrobacter sp. N25K4-3-2 TaxID=2785026 RepID=UPI00188A7ABB|nr:tetratricopeptide repeat protein [Psychrobacter sp. N25K4-3-2]MBF4488894.1 sel1 repeat family protein [Psychrobacter sp. N25K4-3-2]
MSASPLTPLDYIAAGYWQDFLANRPIAGSIAYETELRDCVLDESLSSLQRVDTLLSQIRRDLIKMGNWDEATLLTDERYRNLMMFLAFYAGQVLAQQWQATAHWYGQFELRKRYPIWSLSTDDFYQHMAVLYSENNSANINANANINDSASLPIFFALEPIGLRLFGHVDRPFVAVQGGQVASGLYQAVSARLPVANNDYVSTIITQDNKSNVAARMAPQVDLGSSSIDSNSQTVGNSAAFLVKQNITVTQADDLNEEASTYIVSDRLTNESLSNEQENQLKPEPSKAELPVAQTIPLVETKPAAAVKPSSTPEIFSQLLIELDEIERPQTAGNAEDQQARKVLDQFEQHVAKQSKPRAQINFSENHLAAKKQALLKLQEAAHVGNTAAMLRLAMYELLGEGLMIDKNAGIEAGVEWVKQAASKDDSRAQRLLSKMYYQGVGVVQDINNGKYWLEQAAQNGHVEAASLVAQWQQAQTLITTQKQEQHSIKRYQLLLAVVLVVAVLILIIV